MATLLPFSLSLGDDKKKSALDILRAPALTYAGANNSQAKTQPQVNTASNNQQSPAMNRALLILQQRQPAPIKPQTTTIQQTQTNQYRPIVANQFTANSATITTPNLKTTQNSLTNNLYDPLKPNLTTVKKPELKTTEKTGWKKYYDEEFKKERDSQNFFQRLMDQGSASRIAEQRARSKYANEIINKAWDENGNVKDQAMVNLAKLVTNENSQVSKAYGEMEKAKSRAIGASYDSDYKDNRFYATANAIRNMSLGDAILGAGDTQKASMRDVGKFLIDLVPGVLTAPIQGGTHIAEAISGKGTDSSTGKHRDLDALERLGRGASGAIDAAGVFFGGSGEMLNSIGSAIFKKGATETAKQAVKQTSKATIKAYIKAMIEEGAEEGIQQAFEFFGDGGKLITKDGEFDNEAFGQLLGETAQAAALGAVGGGIFKGVGDVGSLAINGIKDLGSNMNNRTAIRRGSNVDLNTNLNTNINENIDLDTRPNVDLNTSVDTNINTNVETNPTINTVTDQNQNVAQGNAEALQALNTLLMKQTASSPLQANLDTNQNVTASVQNPTLGADLNTPKLTETDLSANKVAMDQGNISNTPLTQPTLDAKTDIATDTTNPNNDTALRSNAENIQAEIDASTPTATTQDAMFQAMGMTEAQAKQFITDNPRETKKFKQMWVDGIKTWEQAKDNLPRGYNKAVLEQLYKMNDIVTAYQNGTLKSSNAATNMSHEQITDTAMKAANGDQSAANALKQQFALDDANAKTGDFGKQYTQYSGKPHEALEYLMLRQQGEVPSAMYSEKVQAITKNGNIDFVYGKTGTDGFGLAHIAEKHGMDMVWKLPEIIENGEVVTKQNIKDRLYIQSADSQAVVRLDWDGKEKQWITTAFTFENPATKVANNSTERTSPVLGASEATINPTLSQDSGNVKGERRQSKFATETATASEELSGEFKKKLKTDAAAGKGATYEAATDADTLKKTDSFMRGKTLSKAEAEITERLNVKPGKATKQDISDALAVVKQLEAKGDTASFERAEQIIDKISEHASKSGQAIQALTLLSNKTPEGILYGATKALKKAGVEVTPEIRNKLQGNIKQIVEKRKAANRAQAELDQISQKLDAAIRGDSSFEASSTNEPDQQSLGRSELNLNHTQTEQKTKSVQGGTDQATKLQDLGQAQKGKSQQEGSRLETGSPKVMNQSSSPKSSSSYENMIHQLREKSKANQIATDELNRAYGVLGKTVADARSQQFKDIYSSIIKGGMLSAPTTHIKNITSNSTFRVMNKIADLVSVPIDKIASAFTKKRSRAFTMQGEWEGIRKGLGYAAETMRTGLDELEGGSQKYASGSSELHFDNKLADMVIGKPNRTIFRAMSAGDKPFRYGAQTNKLYELAILSAKEQKLTGKAKEAYIQKFVYDPPADALSKAMDAGEKAVLGQQNKAASWVSKAVAAGKNSQNPVAKFFGTFADSHIVPFVKVPTNFLVEAYRYTPANGAVEVLKQTFSKNSRNQEKLVTELSKSLTGTSTMIAAGMALSSAITSSYPDDQKERNRWEAEGIKENSLKVGDTYIPLEAFGPASLLMGAGATFKKEMDNGSPIWDAGFSSLSEFTQRLTDQSFLTGVSEAINVLKGGDFAGTGTTYAKSIASSLVPNIIRKAATATDEYQRAYDKNDPAKAILQGITGGIPGLRQATMAKKVDVYGNELKSGSYMTSFLDPTNSSRAQQPDNEMLKEVARLNEVSKQDGWSDEEIATLKATPSKVKSTFGPQGNTVKLTDAEQRDLQTRVGQKITEVWQKTMASSEYKTASDLEKAQMLDDAKSAATNLVQQQFAAEKGYTAPKMTSDAKKLENGTFTAQASGTKTKGIEIADGLDSAYKEVLNKYQNMSSDEWKDLTYKDKAAEYHLALAKFENSKAKGELTDAQIVTKQKELRKLKVTAGFDKTVRDYYGLAGTRADLQAALDMAESEEQRSKMVDELNKLNRAMYDAGVITASTYKTRNRNINNLASSSSRSGSGSSSKKKTKEYYPTPQSGKGFTAYLNSLKNASSSSGSGNGKSTAKPTLKAGSRRSNVIGNYVTKVNKTNLGGTPKITVRKG